MGAIPRMGKRSGPCLALFKSTLLLLFALALSGCALKLPPGVEHSGDAWENGLGMKFVLVPPGEFVMGSSAAEIKALIARVGEGNIRPERVAPEKPDHLVRITKPLLFGRHEVTVGQFRRFVEAAGYKTDAERGGGSHVSGGLDTWEKKADANWRSPGFKQADDHPVVCVSWNDAARFIAWLNKADRARPRGWAYRLPTEAEWEWTARGPDRFEWAWGNDWDGTRANFADKSSRLPWGDKAAEDGHARTAPVGSYSPKGDTPLGLADMTGNVWEWCHDWFDPAYYETSPAKDPVNKKEGNRRVERGGGWAFTPDYCRAAFRFALEPNESYDTLGFRVVLAPAGR
ncbi:MAG TPA: SUMF1/EgtB/PvdO family nonheme iron enzyme [Planctomycetota bacterium]|nr:SUMF1/EgtB/PvdO family nonheme iron enzyme [Planctomycetota bacterium]